MRNSLHYNLLLAIMLQDHIDKIMNMFEEPVHQPVPLYEEFKPPIDYLSADVYTLPNNVVADLEIAPTNEDTPTNMYHHLCNPQNEFMVENIKKNGKYTTDVNYLENNQIIIKNMEHFDNSLCDICCNHFLDVWNETKENSFFLEKYCYMDWNIFKHFNKSSFFLQIMSILNISSPVIALLLPIIFLVIPFIILRLQGISMTFSNYVNVLQNVAKNHFIGKIFNIRNMDFSSFMYFLLSLGLYGMQVYQNINICMRFYNNINVINTHLYNMKQYLGTTINTMEKFVIMNQSLTTHNGFINDIDAHRRELHMLHTYLKSITPFKPSIFKITEVGYLLKVFYTIHDDAIFEKSIQYSAGFMGYIHNMRSIHSNVLNGHIQYATFSNTQTKIKGQYYPPYVDSKHVKNDCSVKKMIITGPNASGKTTALKTTALNIIFSQQYGVGFYTSCTLNPYDYIHSYLNIPDTSGRDSLFQAESRRCKEIIDVIECNKEKRHFTIFDELFSGTNPSEATKSAFAFLKYISEFDNVDFILTTHYTSICKKLGKMKKVQNYKMDVVFDENDKIKYSYKMVKGISKVQGALLILEDMNYPTEILDSIKNYE